MEPNRIPLVVPSPRDHLKGTLAMLEGLHIPSALQAFLDRPQMLPSDVPADEAGLKYDMYLNAGPEHVRWGVSIADRHEESMLPAVRELAAALDGDYRLDAALSMREQLSDNHAVCVALGFDNAGAAPRLKIYFQEDPWGAGIATVGQLRSAVPHLPDWIDDTRTVGVLTVAMYPDGRLRPKIYLGGETAEQAAKGSPAMDLANTMSQCCPEPGYYYLTVRPDPSHPQYAINKIYNTIQVGFINGGTDVDAAWQDVERLFAAAGQSSELTRLQERWKEQDHIRVIPTATALEAGGKSVDVYCAAWDVCTLRCAPESVLR